MRRLVLAFATVALGIAHGSDAYAQGGETNIGGGVKIEAEAGDQTAVAILNSTAYVGNGIITGQGVRVGGDVNIDARVKDQTAVAILNSSTFALNGSIIGDWGHREDAGGGATGGETNIGGSVNIKAEAGDQTAVAILNSTAYVGNGIMTGKGVRVGGDVNIDAKVNDQTAVAILNSSTFALNGGIVGSFGHRSN